MRSAGVQHLFLHGSYARGTESRGSSDVDVIAEFEPGRRLSLLDMVAIENRLTELLGARVVLHIRVNELLLLQTEGKGLAVKCPCWSGGLVG